MKLIAENGVPFYQFDRFLETEGISHAVFTRQGGVSFGPFNTLNLSVSVPDEKVNVFINREKAYGTHKRTNKSLVHAHLTHGIHVAKVTRQDYGQYIGPADGLITNEPGCGLTMNYADCAPIFLYDPINKAIGLGHAGWKGAVKDLPGALVKGMKRQFGTDPSRLVAGIGPCIGPCCYEVDEPVISAVHNAFSDSNSLLVPKPGNGISTSPKVRPHFDLPAANLRRLVSSGVKNIEESGLCTACRTDIFFSHRADKGLTGRFGVLLILED